MRRALPFLFLLLATLGACKAGDDPRAPFTDSRIPPGLEHRFYPPEGWAWGLLQLGKAPPARYGVAAPKATARSQVLILPGYGEPAEAWFEIASELIAHGCAVWILEPSGQGGSGRYGRPRDLVHAPSLDPDVAALLLFPSHVARDRPLFVLASGESAPIALRAAELGLQADGLILSDPVLQAKGDLAKARRMRRFGLGGMRAYGGGGWKREEAPVPAGRDPARSRLSQAWQIANPDLRMGGPSWAWRAAFADELQTALAERSKVNIPVTVLRIGEPVGQACKGIPICWGVMIGKPGGSFHLGDDGIHGLWLSSILIVATREQGALASSPAAATLDDQS